MKHKFIFKTENLFNDSDMIITHYITTITPDRFGDVINPSGLDDKNYRKNPVVLFGHNSRNLVIGKNLSLTIDDYGVIAETKFADTTTGKEIYKLNRDGFLNAWSIGYIPLKINDKINSLFDKGNYNLIEKWELVEYSSVPIPANPDAINLMMKSITSEEIKDIFKYSFYSTNFLIDFKNMYNSLNDKINTLESKITDKLSKIIKYISINKI